MEEALFDNKLVVAVESETFNTIKIYGFGYLKNLDNCSLEVELEDGRTVNCNSIVLASNWASYVDERAAKVKVIK